MKPDGFLKVIKDGRLKVVPEDSTELVTLVAGHFQKIIHKILVENRKKDRPTRLAIVKARRLQISTGVACVAYGDMVTNSNFRSLVVSHDDDAIATLKADVYDVLKDNDPDAPDFKYDSAERVQTKDGARIQYAHAKGELGRGGKKDLIHFSEADFYPDFFKTMKAVPKSTAGHSVIVVETTLGDRPAPQFREWLRSLNQAQKDGTNTSEWQLLFFGWQDFPHYRMRCSPKDREFIRTSLTTREKELMENGVDFDQLKWRRYMIETEFMGDERGFDEEYPDDLDRLLKQKGNHYYRPDVLEWYEQNTVCDPDRRYEVQLLEGAPDFVETSRQDEVLEVWATPQPGKDYVAGVDVTDGKSPDGKDNSCMWVIDSGTGEQVAEWVGRIPYDDFGDIVYCIAKMFGDAWLNIERNGPGESVINRLYELGYFNIGMSKRIAVTGRTEETHRAGQRTDRATRPWLLGQGRRVVHKKTIKIKSAGTIAEMRTFLDLGGKPQAQNKKFRDDRVFGMSLAVTACDDREMWASKTARTQNGAMRNRRVVKEETAEELLNNLRRGNNYKRYGGMLGLRK